MKIKSFTFPKVSSVPKLMSLCATEHKSHEVVHLSYKPYSTSERLSLVLRKCFDEFVDFSGSVVEMWGDPEAITAGCGDDILRVELVIKRHRR